MSIMKQLYVTVGAPAVGKSTWIKENGYEDITLSPDTIRYTFIPEKYEINEADNSLQKVYNADYEAEVWNVLYSLVRARMTQGEDIIIDATFLFKQAFRPALDLAREFNYTIRAIGFMQPLLDKYGTQQALLEELVARDEKRAHESNRLPIPRNTLAYKIKYYVASRNDAQIKRVLPDEVTFTTPTLDFDAEGYNRVKIIGDIHSDYTNLENIFEDHTKGTAYIFVGDYLDRGSKPVETFKFMQNLKGKNIYLLEGNHEKGMFNYGRGHAIGGGQFKTHSLPKLNDAGITKEDIAKFVKRLQPVVRFTFQGSEYIVSHAGIEPYVVDKGLDVNATKYIMGYDSLTNSMYQRDVDKAYAEYKTKLPINIHGHRNEFDKDIITQDTNISVNLNEVHDKFRWVVLENGGITPHETKRIDIPNPIEEMFADPDVRSVPTQVSEDIYAYNFTKEVFQSTFKGKNNMRWTPRTVKARGYFTRGDEVVGRAFNKFFAIGETPDAKIENLTFPVSVYKKYNGFLAIAFWDTKEDKLRFVTKSGRATFNNGTTEITLDADDMIMKVNRGKHTIKRVTQYLNDYFKENKSTSVLFEALYEEDVHVVPEALREGHTIVPIAVVNNEDGTFNTLGESHFQIKPEKRYTFSFDKSMWQAKPAIFETKEVLEDYINRFGKGELKEGYVLRDATGNMLKYKTPTYLKAKEVRGKLERYSQLGEKKFKEAGGLNPDKYYNGGLPWVKRLLEVSITTYNPKVIEERFYKEVYK